MILYRLQVSRFEDWSIEWHPTQAEAFAAFDKIVADVGAVNDIYLDEVEVSTTKVRGCSGRENLAGALTHAHANREVWPGDKELKRHTATKPDADVEDLLS